MKGLVSRQNKFPDVPDTVGGRRQEIGIWLEAKGKKEIKRR